MGKDVFWVSSSNSPFLLQKALVQKGSHPVVYPQLTHRCHHEKTTFLFRWIVPSWGRCLKRHWTKNNLQLTDSGKTLGNVYFVYFESLSESRGFQICIKKFVQELQKAKYSSRELFPHFQYLMVQGNVTHSYS